MGEFSDTPVNPFAPPATTRGGGSAPPAGSQGVWRDGDKIVMLKQAHLPVICVKTGQPAETWLERKYSWCHPAWLLLLLVGLLPAVIVILIVSKRATIKLPLSQAASGTRRQRILIGWGLFLSSIASLVLAIVLAEKIGGLAAILFLGFFVLLFAGIIVGSIAARVLAPTRITDQFVWLKGAHPQFLDRLEVWDPSYQVNMVPAAAGDQPPRGA